MQGYYFAKHEQIERKKGTSMIIMDIKVDNLYAFKKFHMNMSYPKKIVDSTIRGEYLSERTNFRYKKVNIIMGGNASGKTSLGRVLMSFMNYLEDGVHERFFAAVNNEKKPASLEVDFVTSENILFSHRLTIYEKEVSVEIFATDIEKRDSYETCRKRIDERKCREVKRSDIETEGWSFSYPKEDEIDRSFRSIEEDERYVHILERILKTLDPAIKEVNKSKEVKNTYYIELENDTVIIQDGQIYNPRVLSSGTRAGIEISYIIASCICDMHDLYYCDELFSYVNSDIEKACLSIIIERLDRRKQLFFTSHNTDVLDMQLPKHAFTFLKKDIYDEERPIKCVNAAQFLKRNTDSLKHAVENDLFCIAPELDKLFEIAEM